MTTLTDSIPLCYLRIWCRRHIAWLSFKTRSQDRYLVSPRGYFIELPDGSLAPISPRVNFPRINRFSSVELDDLVPNEQFGEDAYFVALSMTERQRKAPYMVRVEELKQDPLSGIPWVQTVEPIEHYLLVKSIANSLTRCADMSEIGERRTVGETVGTVLVHRGICLWEPLLACCLGVRTHSQYDVTPLRVLIERRDFELIGEILFALNCVTRKHLEYAVKINREGNESIAHILAAMGTVKQQDLDECLNMRRHLEGVKGSEVALVGALLVGQGTISSDDLATVLSKQTVAAQPLARILVSSGVCTQQHINQYAVLHGGMSFQQEIDEAALGKYLLRTETITKKQLDACVHLQQRGRQVIQEILISFGLSTGANIEGLLVDQRGASDHCRSGVEMLGAQIWQTGKVPSAKIEKALELQWVSRQPIGATLVALGACSAEDVQLALDIQTNWRGRERHPDDRLGEMLVRRGILSKKDLEKPLSQQVHQEKPLGRILVGQNLYTPEEIIDWLLTQDYTRQMEFVEHARRHQKESSTTAGAVQGTSATNQDSLARRISTWLSKKSTKN